MMIPPFASSNLPMPRWAYVPGEIDEANADYDTSAQAKLLVPPRFRGYVPWSCSTAGWTSRYYPRPIG